LARFWKRIVLVCRLTDLLTISYVSLTNSLPLLMEAEMSRFIIMLLTFSFVPFAAAAQECDPNYGGACVPIASDVDCAGGSGNGPAYVVGPVYVIGRDVYGLDRDGDGRACER
jgi:hypothetical protein